MPSPESIREAHEFLRWSTDRFMATARTYSDDELHRTLPIGLGSVFETLLHLLGAEMIWIGVVTGTVDRVVWPTRESHSDLEAIERQWKATRAEWDRYLAALTPPECDRIVERVRDGKVYKQRCSDACMQVPTHALYHAAQLSFIHRNLRGEGPNPFSDSSWIVWARQRAGNS
jgi:uncharacterized damage-inducible protein DinB